MAASSRAPTALTPNVVITADSAVADPQPRDCSPTWLPGAGQPCGISSYQQLSP